MTGTALCASISHEIGTRFCPALLCCGFVIGFLWSVYQITHWFSGTDETIWLSQYHWSNPSCEVSKPQFDFRPFQSLCNLAGTFPAGLSRCMSNFRAKRPLWLRDFTRSCSKTSVCSVNRGSGYGWIDDQCKTAIKHSRANRIVGVYRMPVNLIESSVLQYVVQCATDMVCLCFHLLQPKSSLMILLVVHPPVKKYSEFYQHNVSTTYFL